jgi:hypothetical protein
MVTVVTVRAERGPRELRPLLKQGVRQLDGSTREASVAIRPLAVATMAARSPVASHPPSV